MTRAAAAGCALALFVIPLVVAPIKPVAVVGALGLLLATAAIVGLWRWPAIAAACVFLVEYAGALWTARASLNVGAALAFGLALVLLLQSVELGRGLRRASVEARLVRSQIAAWLAFAGLALGVTLLGVAVARGLAASIPFAAAPFLAALAALGVVVTLAALVKRS